MGCVTDKSQYPVRAAPMRIIQAVVRFHFSICLPRNAVTARLPQIARAVAAAIANCDRAKKWP